MGLMIGPQHRYIILSHTSRRQHGMGDAAVVHHDHLSRLQLMCKATLLCHTFEVGLAQHVAAYEEVVQLPERGRRVCGEALLHWDDELISLRLQEMLHVGHRALARHLEGSHDRTLYASHFESTPPLSQNIAVFYIAIPTGGC